MDPQAVLLAIYAASQMLDLISKQMAAKQGLTAEELHALWEASRAEFESAVGLWRK